MDFRKTKNLIEKNINSVDEMIENLQIANEGLLSGKINYFSPQINYVLINSEKFFILNKIKENGIKEFDDFKSSFDSLVDTLAAFGNDSKENYFSKEKLMPDVDRKQEIDILIKHCYQHCENNFKNDEFNF